jgi:hypothetical protein
MPREGTAQDTKGPSAPKIFQNYPNPFNPETTIPFAVGGYPNCPEPSRRYKVSLKIYNIIVDLVAVPVLKGSSGGVNGGTPLDQVSLPCGAYEAYWDGKNRNNGREAASGIYLMRFDQDGVTVTKRAISAK